MSNSKENQLVINNENYSHLNDVLLEEVREYFGSATFKALTEVYEITSLGILFSKTSNGELKKTIMKMPGYTKEYKERYYNKILAIVNILKCKYLNTELSIDANTPVDEFDVKLGLSSIDISRLREAGIKTFSELLKMFESNDYSSLLLIPRWGKNKVKELNYRIEIIYNYLKSKENQNTKQLLGRDITMSEIYALYDELKKLIVENNRLSEEINILQSMIDERKIDKKTNDSLKESDSLKLSNISIIEVKNFFSQNNFEFLIKHGFLTLEDLLNANFTAISYDFHDRPYNEKLKIISTIKILRCKYLGENPEISPKISYKVFENQLGISFKTQMFLHNKLGINNLGELLQLIERKEFSILNQIESDDLIPKLIVLYNFYKNQFNSKQQNFNEDNSQLILYKNLKVLLLRNEALTKQIDEIGIKLDEKFQKVKGL